MKNINITFVVLLEFILGIFLSYKNFFFLIPYIFLLIVLEIGSYFLVKRLRKESSLFITPADEQPELSHEGLQKFFKHGYDPELGWIRKPNTEKKERGKHGETSFHIDEKGNRKNPGHEHLPTLISCYGDSFTFARQVNDNQTWEWYLSELTKSNVLNFGVGNYGIDQALLRVKREYDQNKTKIVIMGIVPSTIIRILGVWKHYHDYGNTFGFKPFFTVRKGNLTYHPNYIDSQEKFARYQEFLPEIRKYDYFYKTKFRKELFEFPYAISILSRPMHNLPLVFLYSLRLLRKKKEKSYEQRASKNSSTLDLLRAAHLYVFTPMKVKLFKDKSAVELLTSLVEEFKRYSKEHGFEAILLWMPQKDDVLFMRKRGIYYEKWLADVSQKIKTIDLTPYLLKDEKLADLFSDDNTDGGHFSAEGNRKVAGIIYEKFRDWNLL